MKDYSEEIKELIKNYKKENVEYGKPLEFFLSRINATRELVEEEILSCKNLVFTEKQEKDSEIRYALFFIYSRKKGRKYLIALRGEKLRIVTIFPLGRRTLRRYRKKGLNI